MTKEPAVKNIILKTDILSDLSINPAKTIFWIGAGVGALSPCNLPLGNQLTDAILDAVIGTDNKEKLISLWNSKIHEIKNSVQNNDWIHLPRKYLSLKSDKVSISNPTDRPRLEFIIGEMHNLDVEFQNISFQKECNQKTYQRTSVLKALQNFSLAEPNVYHYMLADLARSGSIMVTTNFDVCIEKALGLKDSEMNAKDVHGIKAIEYAKGQYVYHVHGIATDEHIETNLGATLTNVSKSLFKQFTNMLCKCFEDGYTIIFVGYGGVDFFDIKPFFDSLKNKSFPGKAIYLHYCSEEESEAAVKLTKNYQYLLSPFSEQIICYGDTEIFLKNLFHKSGMFQKKYPKSNVRGIAFDHTIDTLSSHIKEYSTEDIEKYRFVNMFRIASQLNISLKWFYLDWADRLTLIYNDWKDDAPDNATLNQMVLCPKEITRCIVDDIRNNNWYSQNPIYAQIRSDILQIFEEREKHTETRDLYLSQFESGVPLQEYINQTCKILSQEDDNPESIALEIAIVHYLCGPHTKRLFRDWIIKIPHRHKIETQLRELLAYIDQLLQYPYNHFLYMTFYIGLNRRKHIINAILDKGPKKKKAGLIYSSFDDIYSSKTKIYGDIQTEWDICMETPNLFDAGKIIQGIIEQYICKMARGKPANPLSLYKLFKIQHKIIDIRKD